MLNPESVKKYFGQADLWELAEHLRHRLDKGDNDPVEVEIDKLLVLVEQALWPAWFHGYLGNHGMYVVLQPRNPGGCPEYGIVTVEGDGKLHVDAVGSYNTEEMVDMLDGIEAGEVILPTTVVEFVMSNPTLMKGFRFWVKQRKALARDDSS